MKQFLSWFGRKAANGIVTGLFIILTVSSITYALTYNWSDPTSIRNRVAGNPLTSSGWNLLVGNVDNLNERLNSLPAESDPTVNALGKATLSCSSGQVAKWNGSTWACAADTGITSESDPKVGTLTNGKWCTTNGSAINCISNTPNPAWLVIGWGYATSCSPSYGYISCSYGVYGVGTASQTCTSGTNRITGQFLMADQNWTMLMVVSGFICVQ